MATPGIAELYSAFFRPHRKQCQLSEDSLQLSANTRSPIVSLNVPLRGQNDNPKNLIWRDIRCNILYILNLIWCDPKMNTRKPHIVVRLGNYRNYSGSPTALLRQLSQPRPPYCGRADHAHFLPQDSQFNTNSFAERWICSV